MLNSYRVTPKVDARTTNNYALDFNAVSGTLCKSHPKSFFVWFQKDSEVERWLMGAHPSYCVAGKKESWTDDEGKFHYQEYKQEPVVLLQAMLTGENRVIAEIVREEDFCVPVKGVPDGD